QDRLFLEGGVGWWKQITAAIDSVESLILVVTPIALLSGTLRREWRDARPQGGCVYPGKGGPGAELRFHQNPGWMGAGPFFRFVTGMAHFPGASSEGLQRSARSFYGSRSGTKLRSKSCGIRCAKKLATEPGS